MKDYKKQVLEAVVGPAFEHGWGQEEGLFQKDNASIHGTRGRLKIRKQELGICLFDWPSSSPNLSPIENVWRLQQPYLPSTTASLDPQGPHTGNSGGMRPVRTEGLEKMCE